MKPKSLKEWLIYQEALHDSPIELGLDRVGRVADRLGLNKHDAQVITVAGTNGKGSCVAMLSSILVEAGYRVGSYTSPHLLYYNERIRINHQAVTDEVLCQAFECVDEARFNTTLSYFEFGTLAALHVFDRADIDVMILEVGLGGRLDAVNIRDPDIAIITSIGIDHTDWLGTDREAIGFEKAGIMRPGRPVICGDLDPPKSISLHAKALHAILYNIGEAFRFDREASSWNWYGPKIFRYRLPAPGLMGKVQIQNAATVLMALSLLEVRLPIDPRAIGLGLEKAALPGRYQRVDTAVETFLDIAHNPAASAVLAQNLRAQPFQGHTHAVFAVLSDKDVDGIVKAMQECVDFWYLTEVDSIRALSVKKLRNIVRRRVPESKIHPFSDAVRAYREASREANLQDRIIVFGSAQIVASVLRWFGS
ncbi:MAG: bifunctional tetrahydrofolate synthase/dihydrofolate synthase [Pseudomonadota bacterium]